MNGENLTTFGVESGAGYDFKKDVGAMLDIKGSKNYDKQGIVGANVRLRTKLGKKSESLQVRISPATLNIPVGDKGTSIYLNPHYSGQMNFREGKWTNSMGAFCGVKQSLCDGKVTFWVEGQRYNLQNITDNQKKNWSVNASVAYNF